jgi:Protein of unknown function (DUF551)
MTVEEFYQSTDFPKLDKHDRKSETFTYYELLDFAERFAGQSAPKWISVEERLPDYNTRVLVKFRPQQPVMEGTLLGIDERVEVSKASLPPNMKDAMKFRNCFKFYNVVEWMPLPQK